MAYSTSAYDAYQQSLGGAREAVEEDQLRKALFQQALSSGYEAWSSDQAYRTQQLLDEEFTIGDDTFKKYEDTSNWFKNLYTGHKGRVGLTPEYQEAINTKRYGQAVKDNPWMTAQPDPKPYASPSISTPTFNPNQPMRPLKQTTGAYYGSFEDGTPMTLEDWEFFEGQDVLDSESIALARKGQSEDYANLDDPISQNSKKLFGNISSGIKGSKTISNISGQVKDYFSKPRGRMTKGITQYKFGAGGKDLTSAGNVTGGITPAAQNLLSSAPKAAGKAVGQISGTLNAVAPYLSAYDLATTDTKALTGKYGSTTAAKTGSGAASNILGIASAVPGPHQAITAPLSVLFGLGSV